MDNPDITIEEYIQLETEKALRHAQVFNWKTATYGKVRYFEDIDYFKIFETELPAIVYKYALTSEPEVSPELTVSPHHVKEVNFEISFAKSDDEDYTVIYDKESFSYKIISANDVKLDTDNDDGKIDVKLSSESIFIEPLGSVIDTNVDTYSHAFGENFETNHDTPCKSFTIKDFVIMIKVMIQKSLNEGMPLIFIIKNLYVSFGTHFDPKRFYKDGAYTRGCGGQVIIEQRVKVNQKARILVLKQRNHEDIVLTTNTPYPSRKIWRICALNFTQHRRRKINTSYPE
ncbi:hypothetical protein Tco_1316156 [Tanacetum coccineum]